MQLCRKQTEHQFNPHTLFPQMPTVHIEPEESVCTCESHPILKVMKTKTREVRTMHIGPFYVHETIKICPLKNCKKTYRHTGLDVFLLQGSNFGYDIIEHVGDLMWNESRTALQIQTDLKRKNNIFISESEITLLAKKYVYYIVEAQRDKQSEIKQLLQRGGGYFLYFDAMHPGDGSAHLMCAIAEEVSEKINIILGSVKLPKESTETVSAFLRDLKEKYGAPLAGICDMLASNLNAFREVFPDVLLLICHFHFLRGLGKMFMEYENTKLQNTLKQYDMNKRLKEFAKTCKARIELNPELASYLKYDEKKYNSSFHVLPEVVKAYCMTMWILAYEHELNGYGFPFDRSNLVYLQRMKKTYEGVRELLVGYEELFELQMLLASILEDSSLQKEMAAMEKKAADFDDLRSIMKIAPIYGMKGLNDDGEECDMTAMEALVKNFIESERIKNNKDGDYKKMINQIQKYWKMLFAKPVKAILATGEIVFVYPGRTSNCMERLFREVQRMEYKRTGMSTLGRTVRAMIAETPMMKNLRCPEYAKIILNGQPTLSARFAQLDMDRMQKSLKDVEQQEKLPAGLKKLMRNSDFHKIFIRSPKLAKKVA